MLVVYYRCNAECNVKIFLSDDMPSWVRSTQDKDLYFGYIDQLNQDQIAYATQASEAVIGQFDSNELKMEILRENLYLCDEKFYVAVEKYSVQRLKVFGSYVAQDGTIDFQNVTIEFEVKHFYFGMLEKAVRNIQPLIIQRILPNIHDFKPFDQLNETLLRNHLYNLDRDQHTALRVILSSSSRSPPVIVSGSFGTGKTRLLAIASCCLINQGRDNQQPVRILVCTHHQATADTFIEKYFEPFLQEKTGLFELVRLISRNQQVYKHSKYCKTSWEIKSLSESVIVVTTFLTSFHLRFLSSNFFTHIFMDESSQSREPEAIVPLSLASSDTKIVVVGDSHQVRQIINLFYCCKLFV